MAFTFSASPSSSVIKGIAYSEQVGGQGALGALVLTVEGGLTYLYTGVPKSVATGLLGAESVGKFYNKEIKGKYPYLKVGLQDQAEIPIDDRISPGTDPGNRNNHLYQIAMDLLHKEGKSKETVAKMMVDINNNFQSPLSQTELDDIFKRASKK